MFAFVGSVGASIGVIAGGLLTELLSWRWVFLVNVPLGLVLVPAALRILPDDSRSHSREPRRRRREPSPVRVG